MPPKYVHSDLHISEQNLFGILCLTLVMPLSFISGLCAAVLELQRDITQLEYKSAQQAECPFACVTYVDFIHK